MSETTLAEQPRSAEPDYDAIAAQLLADITELEKKMDQHSAASDRHLASIKSVGERTARKLTELEELVRSITGPRQ
jgi:hypothetical protein